MRTKNLLWGALACLAFAACSDDDVVVNPGGEGGTSSNATSFLAVSITMPGNVTRATWGSGDEENDDNYKKGDDEETTVNSAYLFFFEEGGNAWGTPRNIYAELTANGGSFSDPTEAGKTIDKLSKPIIMFENQDVPHSVVAVLNLNDDQATELGSKSLSEFRKTLNVNSAKWNTTGYGEDAQGFIMSNSAYQATSTGDAAATTNTEVYAQVLGNHLIEGEANASIEYIRQQALNDPLIIPVERTLARVHVDFEKTSEKNNTQYTYNGSIYVLGDDNAVVAQDVEIVSVVNGWWLHNTPTESYLVKDLDNISSDENITSWTTWNDATNYRSYWAVPYAGTDELAQEYVAQYYSMNNMVDKYSFENTQQEDNKVELVVSANLWWKTTEGNATEGTWERLDMIRWKQLNYTVEAFKQYVVGRIQSELKVTEFSCDNLEIAWNTKSADKELGDGEDKKAIKDWQAVLTLNDGYTDDEGKVQNFLNNQIGAFMYYNQGKTYYHTPIVHNTLDESDDKLYGVIRNHYYSIKVTGITGLGTPVPTPDPTEDPDPTDPDDEPEDPEDDDPEVPEDPEDDDDDDNPITPDDPQDDQVSAIATEIAILKYRVVTQEAVLSGGATTPDTGDNE